MTYSTQLGYKAVELDEAVKAKRALEKENAELRAMVGVERQRVGELEGELEKERREMGEWRANKAETEKTLRKLRLQLGRAAKDESKLNEAIRVGRGDGGKELEWERRNHAETRELVKDLKAELVEVQHMLGEYEQRDGRLVSVRELEREQARAIAAERRVQELELKVSNTNRAMTDVESRLGKEKAKRADDTPRPRWDVIHGHYPRLTSDVFSDFDDAGQGAPTAQKVYVLVDKFRQLHGTLRGAMEREEATRNELLQVQKALGLAERSESSDEDEDLQARRGKLGPDRYFACLGQEDHVPPFLRFDGRVPLKSMSKRDVEHFVREFWRDKEKADASKNAVVLSPGDFLHHILKRRFGLQSMIVEFAASLLTACDKYSYDSDVHLFFNAVMGVHGSAVKDAQDRFVAMIKSALEKADVDQHGGKRSGVLKKRAIVKALSPLLHHKSEADFQAIVIALHKQDSGSTGGGAASSGAARRVADTGGDCHYMRLFEEDHDGNQGEFVEELRNGFIRDYLALVEDMEQGLRYVAMCNRNKSIAGKPVTARAADGAVGEWVADTTAPQASGSASAQSPAHDDQDVLHRVVKKAKPSSQLEVVALHQLYAILLVCEPRMKKAEQIRIATHVYASPAKKLAAAALIKVDVACARLRTLHMQRHHKRPESLDFESVVVKKEKPQTERKGSARSSASLTSRKKKKKRVGGSLLSSRASGGDSSRTEASDIASPLSTAQPSRPQPSRPKPLRVAVAQGIVRDAMPPSSPPASSDDDNVDVVDVDDVDHDGDGDDDDDDDDDDAARGGERGDVASPLAHGKALSNATLNALVGALTR